jgi:hypothetical protein
VFLPRRFLVPALLSSGRHEAEAPPQTRCSHLLQASGFEMITEQVVLLFSSR